LREPAIYHDDAIGSRTRDYVTPRPAQQVQVVAQLGIFDFRGLSGGLREGERRRETYRGSLQKRPTR